MEEEHYVFDLERSEEETALGFACLQSGDNRRALEHFKEALICMPYNKTAKQGMLLALKARYWFYRIFWNYSVWMQSKSGTMQWVILLGFYVGSRLLIRINHTFPGVSFITIPLIVLYFFFALTTWIIDPISNLLLRLNNYGKFALSPEEVRQSNWLGTSLLLSLISGLVYLATDKDLFLMSGFFCLTMCIPLGSVFRLPHGTRIRKLFVLYTITMVALGLAAMFVFLSGGEVVNGFATAYIFSFVIYSWVFNAVAIRES